MIHYNIDTNEFPEPASIGSPQPLRRLYNLDLLSQEPLDRFKEGLQGLGGFYADPYISFEYIDPKNQGFHLFHARRIANARDRGVSHLGSNRYWYLRSIGPDQMDYRDEGLERLSNRRNELGIVDYDPTNGVFSLGEIIRTQIDSF